MTWTPEYASGIVRHVFDRTSPIAQCATVPQAFVFIQRINLGLCALLGQLGPPATTVASPKSCGRWWAEVRPLRWVRPSSDGCKPRDIRDG
ncbi:MAG: hypothetical protein R2715_24860 [Ilumatobacteraceae bacterium]